MQEMVWCIAERRQNNFQWCIEGFFFATAIPYRKKYTHLLCILLAELYLAAAVLLMHSALCDPSLQLINVRFQGPKEDLLPTLITTWRQKIYFSPTVIFIQYSIKSNSNKK